MSRRITLKADTQKTVDTIADVMVYGKSKAVEGEKEDEEILNEAKTDAMIRDWFDKWCAKTKRSGGVLITTSIKELLTDFYNDFKSRIK